MKKIYALIISIALPLLLLAQIPGKRDTRYGFAINVKPPIYYTVCISYDSADWQPNFNIVLRIQNDLLQFSKKQETYLSAYEILLTVREKESGKVVLTEIWSEEVREDIFARTNDQSIYQETHKTFALQGSAASYTIDVEVTDLGNRKQFRNKRFIQIHPNDQNSIQVSPIVFYRADSEVANEIHLPERDPIIEFNTDNIIRFAVKNPTTDSIRISSILNRQLDNTLELVSENLSVLGKEEAFFIFNDTLPKDNLSEGAYSLRYIISSGDFEQEIEKKFEVIWYDKPVYLYKFDLALRPMRYILSQQEWEEVDDLSYNQQEKWFIEYWNGKDPTPGTPFNEIKYEFFTRVEEANRIYSLRFVEGWETDRGRALILYGQPDRQEKKSYAVNTKPYEIWYYDSINKKLTFIDVDKDTNYKLVSVENLNEEGNE